MKIINNTFKFSFILFVATSSTHAINVVLGGGTGLNDATDETNWTSNNDAATNGGAGLAYNWENVITNSWDPTPNVDGWDITYETNTNHTFGHGFLFNQTFDLSQTQNGFENLTYTTHFAANTKNNWRLIMVVDGQQYQYNDAGTGNYYNGNNAQVLSNIHASSSWVNINNVGIGGTADTHGTNNPNLQGNTGIVQFGFMQWGASSAGATAATSTLRVNQFEVDVLYTAAVVSEPETYALLLGVVGLIFVMIQRRRS